MSKQQFSLQEEQYFTLLGKVGLVVHLSQMIEYNIANILALDELCENFYKSKTMSYNKFNNISQKAEKWYHILECKPLGYGLKKAQEHGYFVQQSQNRLDEMCDERNYVVHRMFKDDLLTQNTSKNPTFYYERIENLLEEMKVINDGLAEIFQEKTKRIQFNILTKSRSDSK